MNRIYALALALALMLTGCGGKPSPSPAPAPDAPSQPEPALSPAQPDDAPAATAANYEDTYWTAVKYARYVFNGEEYVTTEWVDLPLTEEGDDWWLDLTLYADGTGKLRDVYNFHYSDMAAEGSWVLNDFGGVEFTSALSLDSDMGGEVDEWELPAFFPEDGTDSGDDSLAGTLALDYYDGTVYFRQAPMADLTADLAPGGLVGEWTMVSGMFEGATYDAQEDHMISSLSITWEDDALYADLRELQGYYSDRLTRSGPVTLQENAILYEGCGNETWRVQLGFDPGEADQEFYATLIDLDTLLLQYYFTIDGADEVGYQTFVHSDRAREAFDLLDRLDAQRAQAEEKTGVCLGVDQIDQYTPGVGMAMDFTWLTDGLSPTSLTLLSPEGLTYRIYQNDELLYENDLAPGEAELLLITAAEQSGQLKLLFSVDWDNWFSYDLCRENLAGRSWINVNLP